MKSRILALILILSILTCILAGCADKSEPESTPVTETSQESEAGPSQETSLEPNPAEQSEEPLAETPSEVQPKGISYPVTDAPRPIVLWTSIQNNIQQLMDTWNDLYCLPNAEEATGIALEITTVNFESQAEQFNLMVASGDWPDCVSAGMLYNGGLSKALADEFALGLNDQMLMTYAPDYYEKLSACGELAMKSAMYGDVYPGVYVISDNYYKGRGMMVRQDWLDELGMGVPTTLSELTDVLYAIKAEYNPQFTFWVENDADMVFLNAAFNTRTVGYSTADLATALPIYVIDGEVLCSWAADEYRSYVEWFAALYADGIFDREFYNNFSNSPATRYGNLAQGEIGVWEDSFSSINDWKNYADDENALTVSAVPDLLNENGGNTWGDERNLVNSCYSITTSCEIPDIVLQYWNYFYTDDGITLANYGVEGESFSYVDGEKIYAESVLNNQYNLSYRAALGVSTMNYLVPYYSIESKLFPAYGENAMEAMEVFNPGYQTAEHYYPTGAALTSDEAGTIGTAVADISTFVQETLLKYLTGAEPVTDESWGEFTGQLDLLGLSGCMAVYQSAYDEYLAGNR